MQLTNTSTSVLNGGLPYLTPANTTSTNQLRNSTVDIFLPQVCSRILSSCAHHLFHHGLEASCLALGWDHGVPGMTGSC